MWFAATLALACRTMLTANPVTVAVLGTLNPKPVRSRFALVAAFARLEVTAYFASFTSA